MEVLTFEINEGIAKITLNRPKAFNSVNKALAKALQEALDQCAADANIRAVVLTGSGKAFCAGQDLVEVTTPELMPGFKTLLEEHYRPIILKIRNLEKPVIAAVNGVAAGAGANIALACDIVIASESASFIQAFSGIGLVPDSGGTFFLPRLVGFQKAVALAMLGDKIAAPEAEQMGMIYKVYSKEEFTTKVDQLAQRMAQMPTKGLALTKKTFSQSLTNNLEAQLEVENAAQIEASETEDYQEGVQAFIAKRKPIFKGK
ncbi:MAG TPA: 2-(1,2-epoxy-1,2-dihydrophenyl)acetyl-CoA isomerase [Microscillaceae bacterium]|nr:2-(1,2-epoxy-1,2-dihydrophenyl)acetyl-CoA isomerase [Microscillaceae bacterium]